MGLRTSTDGDRLAALCAAWLVVSWAVAHFYDWYTSGHWWATPILLLGVAALGLIVAGRRLGPIVALAAGTAAGLAEDIWRDPRAQSDVLPAIREAAATLASGHSPYGVPLTSTIPPGAFYEYPPGPLLVYGPAFSIFTETGLERLSALLVVIVIAALAWRIGAGRAAIASTLYGTYLYGAFRAIDSSTETTLAFLLVLGTVLVWRGGEDDRGARWAYWLAVPVFALVVLMKQSAWIIYPFIALYLWRSGARGRRHVLLTAALVIAVMVPFFVAAPAAFIGGLLDVFHKNIYGLNLLGTLNMTQPEIAAAISPHNTWIQLSALAAVTIYMLRRPASSVTLALAQGAAAFAVAAFFARWTSPSYYMLLAILACAIVGLAPLEEIRSRTPVTTVRRDELAVPRRVRVVLADLVNAARRAGAGRGA